MLGDAKERVRNPAPPQSFWKSAIPSKSLARSLRGHDQQRRSKLIRLTFNVLMQVDNGEPRVGQHPAQFTRRVNRLPPNFRLGFPVARETVHRLEHARFGLVRVANSKVDEI